MNEVELWSAAKRAEHACNALVKNGFEAVFVETSEKAAELVMGYIKEGMNLGFGGSMTLKTLGIADKAREKGANILDHNVPGLSPDEKMEILRRQLTCDIFLCSVNALTLKGEMMNIDGNGNRVAAMSFGPKKNIVVAGANKIVANEEEAWARIKAKASPMNNKRLAKENPCVKTGFCMDCNNPTRICRTYQILRRKPLLSDYTVIVVGEDLGF